MSLFSLELKKNSLAAVFIFFLIDLPALAGPGRTPVQTLMYYDSLFEAGEFERAKSLCIGQALKMFDLLKLAHENLAGLEDTAKSSESFLQTVIKGNWAAVKIEEHTVFKKKVMGKNEIKGVLAIHLYRVQSRWKIAEFEELNSREDSLVTRNYQPELSGEPGGLAEVFPLSQKAPVKNIIPDRVNFHIKYTGSNISLAKLLPWDAFQKITRTLSPSEIHLTTFSVGIENRTGVKEKFKTTQLENTSFFNWNFPALVSLARKITAPDTSQLTSTRKLYNWVRKNLKFKLGAALFGTPAEVLQSLEGDCSEAAVLLAAMLRARKIPSRVALGFAHVEKGLFFGHAWVEVYLNNHWVGIDAAMNEFPTGTMRIKLTQLDGKTDMKVAASNLLLKTLSQFQIEITQATLKGKQIKLVAHPENAKISSQMLKSIFSSINSP